MKMSIFDWYSNGGAYTTSTEIQVESETALTEICILDHLGKIMIQIQPNAKQLTIPIQSFPDAMYTIQLKTLNETITKKIVILRN
jgi:hypothetical protein